MNAWPSGANRNCPSEPAAVARPIDHDRRSSGTSRAKAASTIVNEPPARPRPSSTPPVMASAPALVLTAISAVPSAYSTPPTASTRPAPWRSAIAPANGWPMPQKRFCRPIAKANVSRSHPRTADSGSVKSPKLVRSPSVIRAITQPATMVTAVARRMERGMHAAT